MIKDEAAQLEKKENNRIKINKSLKSIHSCLSMFYTSRAKCQEIFCFLSGFNVNEILLQKVILKPFSYRHLLRLNGWVFGRNSRASSFMLNPSLKLKCGYMSAKLHALQNKRCDDKSKTTTSIEEDSSMEAYMVCVQ